MPQTGLKDFTFTRSEGAQNNIVYTLRDTDGNGKFDEIIKRQKEVADKFSERVFTYQGKALEDLEIVTGDKTEKAILDEKTAQLFFKNAVRLDSNIPELNESDLTAAREKNMPTLVVHGHVNFSMIPDISNFLPSPQLVMQMHKTESEKYEYNPCYGNYSGYTATPMTNGNIFYITPTCLNGIYGSPPILPELGKIQ